MRSLPHFGPHVSALVAALGTVLATLAAPTPASAGQTAEALAMQVSYSEASFDQAAFASSALEDAARIVARSSSLLAPFASQLGSAAPAQHAAIEPPTPIDTADANEDAASVEGFALDDAVLSHQRGSGLGAMTVAATPATTQGAGFVTLWDEVAPPAPLPVPVDSGRAAQTNIVTYTRN